MVLAFKVWRLSWDNTGKINKETGKRTPVLVLRDKRGRIIKRADNVLDQASLKKWYEKYNMHERLESLIKSRKLKEAIRLTKRRVRTRGFKYQMSFYGITINEKTRRRQYRRYEVFKATPWLPDEAGFLHKFFKEHRPKSIAGVFILHNGSLFVDGKDELTKLAKAEKNIISPD